MLERLVELPGIRETAAKMTLERAALEYSRVVLQLVPPYASLFLDEDAMLNSAETERVELEYRQAGFQILQEWRAGPADHLGIELHFLAHLLDSRPDEAARFLRESIYTWAPICLLAIARVEESALYAPLASATLDVLRELG